MSRKATFATVMVATGNIAAAAQIDYVGGPYGCAKFGANPSMGGFWANG